MKLHPSNREAYGYTEEQILGEARQKIAGVHRMLERCESPLEQKFLLDWLYYHGHEFRFWESPESAPFLFFDCNFDNGWLCLTNQVPVSAEGQNFRLDFLFTYNSDGFTPTTVLKLAIEIDGHQFHERTKEQARRDRSRDRILTRAGYTVFRFTGAEIYAPFQPMKSPVSEVGNILTDHELRVAESKGLSTPHTYTDESWRER